MSLATTLKVTLEIYFIFFSYYPALPIPRSLSGGWHGPIPSGSAAFRVPNSRTLFSVRAEVNVENPTESQLARRRLAVFLYRMFADSMLGDES